MIAFCETCKSTHEIKEGEPCTRTADVAVAEQVSRRRLVDPPPGSTGYLERYGTLR